MKHRFRLQNQVRRIKIKKQSASRKNTRQAEIMRGEVKLKAARIKVVNEVVAAVAVPAIKEVILRVVIIV